MPGVLRLSGTSSISDNTATNGGGVYGGVSYTVLKGSSSISRNTARVSGGGVYLQFADRSSLYLQDFSSIHDNTAGSQGGGVYDGTVTLKDAGTITGNAPDNCHPPGTVVGCTN